MSAKREPSESREPKHTCFCVWCGERFEAVKNDAQSCSNQCRSRLRRYRKATGMDPLSPPGKLSATAAVAVLVAELLAAERRRREYQRCIDDQAAERSADEANRVWVCMHCGIERAPGLSKCEVCGCESKRTKVRK